MHICINIDIDIDVDMYRYIYRYIYIDRHKFLKNKSISCIAFI